MLTIKKNINKTYHYPNSSVLVIVLNINTLREFHPVFLVTNWFN